MERNQILKPSYSKKCLEIKSSKHFIKVKEEFEESLVGNFN